MKGPFLKSKSRTIQTPIHNHSIIQPPYQTLQTGENKDGSKYHISRTSKPSNVHINIIALTFVHLWCLVWRKGEISGLQKL